MSEYVRTGTMTGDYGDEVSVGVVGAAVVLDAALSYLSPAKQEEFAQLYVAACHQAKVNAGTARPVKHGNHGPGCRCTPCRAAYPEAVNG